MSPGIPLRRRAEGLAPLLLGTWAAVVAALPDTTTKLLLAAPPPLAMAVWWILLEPERWISVLFFGLLLLPPLPIGLGNSGAHPAPAILLLGALSGVLRWREWRPWRGWLPTLLVLFWLTLFGSTALAAFYSGPEVAAGSLARVVLFGIGVYVFLFTLAGPRRIGSDAFVPARWLFRFALLAALLACVDFYFQLPAPPGVAEQFVWLQSGVFRRAQGLFYEASTLGNFCAFFLVMILVAWFGPRERRPVARPWLAAGFVLFSGALMFSYSRGSAVNLVVAGLAFLYVRRIPAGKLLSAATIVGAATAGILRFALPQFFEHYVTRIAVSFEAIGETPDRILSGRLSSWGTLLSFLLGHPLDAILGIGYKTLPYSRYAGDGMVADNTYLSLLLETGIAGLGIFLLLNAAILRTALRAARSSRNRAAFFGTWIFAFWCGELVQMLSGDLITYWRVLPLYFWVLAIAAREAAG